MELYNQLMQATTDAQLEGLEKQIQELQSTLQQLVAQKEILTNPKAALKFKIQQVHDFIMNLCSTNNLGEVASEFKAIKIILTNNKIAVKIVPTIEQKELLSTRKKTNKIVEQQTE